MLFLKGLRNAIELSAGAGIPTKSDGKCIEIHRQINDMK